MLQTDYGYVCIPTDCQIKSAFLSQMLMLFISKLLLFTTLANEIEHGHLSNKAFYMFYTYSRSIALKEE